MIKFILKNTGQSLIEAITALGVASVIIAAIAIAVITSVNNADFSTNQNLATQYAQQGLEIMRQQSEASWGDFVAVANGSTYCLSQNSIRLANCTSVPNINDKNNNPFFVREIKLGIPGGNPGECTNGVLVTSAVKWSDGKCSRQTNFYCHQVSLSTCLANITSVNN